MPHDIEKILIENKDLLWRRILDNPRWWTKTPEGKIRPSSSSFLQREDKKTNTPEKGISVQLAKLTSLEKASSVIESAGIAEFEVEVPQDLGLDVIYDPVINEEKPLESDLAHTLICPPEGEKITKSQARKMAELAKMIILPESERI